MIDPLYRAPQTSPPPAPQGREVDGSRKKMGDHAGMRVLLPVGRSGWAIAAGYLGLLSVTLLLAPISILVSIVAIVSIRKSVGKDEVKRGMGRAIFGLVMGVFGTVGLVVLIVGEMSATGF